MSDKTGIEWTDATWNPITGCTKVSAGCDNCYAETFSERFRGTPGHYFEHGFDLQLRPDKLDHPIRWTRPRRIFVNSMSDLFHDDVPDGFIGDVFNTMALAERHSFQILTKRPGRMRSLLRKWEREASESEPMRDARQKACWRRTDMMWCSTPVWPLPNVWLGVSAEDQRWADIRIPVLLDTPAAVRFVSAEPLLGPIDLTCLRCPCGDCSDPIYEPKLDWVIVGGESGRKARPMHPDWGRALRDQCTRAGVAFHFKQWGEYIPVDQREARNGDVWVLGEGKQTQPWRPDTVGAEAHRWGPHRDQVMRRVGKKSAGRDLDGRTWDEYPGVSS